MVEALKEFETGLKTQERAPSGDNYDYLLHWYRTVKGWWEAAIFMGTSRKDVSRDVQRAEMAMGRIRQIAVHYEPVADTGAHADLRAQRRARRPDRRQQGDDDTEVGEG